jgi:PAS domain S-box-containing protein
LNRSPLQRYGVALLTVAVVVLLKLLLAPLLLSGTPFLLFLSSAMLSAWYGGRNAGIFATLLSAAIGTYFFLPSVQATVQWNLGQDIRLWLFVMQGILVSLIIDSLQKAKQRSAALAKREQAARIEAETAKEQVSLTLESITDAFVALDRDWRFTFVNQKGSQILGRSAAELLGQNLWETFPELAETSFGQLYKRAMTSAEMLELEDYYPPFAAWFALRAYPLPTGLALYFRDVSIRKRAEADLRLSEERYRTLVDAVPQLMWISDAAGQLQFLSQPWQDYTGVPSAQSTGLRWTEVVHPDDMPVVHEIRNQAIQAGETYEVEYRLKRLDHVYRWHLARVVPLKDDRGQVLNWFGTATDIHALKQAESDLQQSNERLRLLSGIASDLLLHEQPKDLIDRLFKQLSAHFQLEVYFNYLIEGDRLRLQSYAGMPEQIANSIEWLALGESVSGAVALLPLVLENVQCSTNPLADFIRTRGITAYVCYPLLSQGQLLGTLAFGTTRWTCFDSVELAMLQTVCKQVATALERSRLITELQQQAEELTRVNRIKDEFLAVLSHELRSPLNPILGWAKLLQSRTLDPALQIKAIETIERNAKLQSQLIEDLLDISRILNGKLKLKVESVDLEATIRAALETVQLAANAKLIQIQTTFVPLQIWGDTNRLQQVVWNLLSNAIKFTPEGGSIEIKLEHSQTQAQITVRDTGKGIRPDFLPYVFESFRQADGSTTRKFGGLGLGLAIVRQVVELHGGTVQAESPGEAQGAVFTVWLPLRSAGLDASDSSPAVTPTPDRLPLSGLQILLVDDEVDSREFVAFVLEQAGALVTAVASATDAIVAWNQMKPDLLISDIGMPETDGYALLRQIRSLYPSDRLSDQPVLAIALTAYAGETDRKRAFQAGFQRHLTKPVEPEKLIEAIGNLVQSRSSEPL